MFILDNTDNTTIQTTFKLSHNKIVARHNEGVNMPFEYIIIFLLLIFSNEFVGRTIPPNRINLSLILHYIIHTYKTLATCLSAGKSKEKIRKRDI